MSFWREQTSRSADLASFALSTGILCVVLSGCSGGGSDRAVLIESVGGSTSAAPALKSERLDGAVIARQVPIPSEGGFVVLYGDEGGVPGLRVGASSRQFAGVAEKIELVVPGRDPVWMLVHRDVNADGDLDFPGIDVVVSDPVTGAIRSELLVSAEPDTALQKTASSTQSATPTTSTVITSQDVK